MNDKNYNTVTPAELIWKALKNWWLIAAFTILGAVVLYKYSNKNYDADMKAYEADNSAYQVQLDQYNEVYDFNTEYRKVSNGTDAEKTAMADKLRAFCEERLTFDQKIAIDDALAVRQQMADANALKDTMIQYKVNPYNIPTVTFVYSVNCELPEQQGTINNYYQNAHNSFSLWNDIFKAMGLPEEEWGAYSGCTYFGFTNGYQFYFTLYHDDLDELKNNLKNIDSALQALRIDIVSKTGLQHTLVQVEANVYTKADTNIVNQQNTNKQWILDYTNRLNSFKNIFNQAANVLQYNYYESYINKEEGGTGYITVKDRTKPKQDDEAAHKPKDPKIMALVGAAAGFFLGFVVLLLIMIFGGRLQKAEELGTLFDLKLVGTILTNTFELPFEKAVKYFRTRRYGAFNTDKNIKLTVMKLKAMCEAENTKKIVLTGTAATKTNKKVLDTLRAELEKQGIEVAACGNILASPLVFEELIKVKTAVFVEREVRSAYKNIEREQMMAGGCGVKILGAICIY